MMRVFLLFAVFAVLTSAAFAHHGWGSYDASKPLTVTGPIVTSKFENPHATITVQGGDKLWTVTLAPTSRMNTPGATQKAVALGQNGAAYRYPRTAVREELPPHRTTAEG